MRTKYIYIYIYNEIEKKLKFGKRAKNLNYKLKN
jgi:hypothetical protein